MKKLVSLLFVATAFSVSVSAQSILDKLGSLGNVISNAAGVVYSAPISLNGTYTYNGVAVSATSSEGGLLTNLAGTAATSAIETKADGYLSKVGIKPGAMTFTFNSEDKTFTMNIGKLSLPGTFTVGDGEKTVSLVFGKKLHYLSMTGSLESSLGNVKMVFPVNKAMSLIKKVASLLGQGSSEVGSIVKLADGYDNVRMGFKMSK
jgi:hypothetical protein